MNEGVDLKINRELMKEKRGQEVLRTEEESNYKSIDDLDSESINLIIKDIFEHYTEGIIDGRGILKLKKEDENESWSIRLGYNLNFYISCRSPGKYEDISNLMAKDDLNEENYKNLKTIYAMYLL